MDCDYISAPLNHVLTLVKESIYKMTISLLQKRIGSQLKTASTKNYSLEKLFLLSASNVTFANFLN